MKTNNKYTLRLSACALALILNPSYGIELFNGKVGNEHVKVSVGGYAKVDVRHVEGDITLQGGGLWDTSLQSEAFFDGNLAGAHK